MKKRIVFSLLLFALTRYIFAQSPCDRPIIDLPDTLTFETLAAIPVSANPKCDLSAEYQIRGFEYIFGNGGSAAVVADVRSGTLLNIPEKKWLKNAKPGDMLSIRITLIEKISNGETTSVPIGPWGTFRYTYCKPGSRDSAGPGFCRNQ